MESFFLSSRLFSFFMNYNMTLQKNKEIRMVFCESIVSLLKIHEMFGLITLNRKTW